ncbi:hypothetical protein FRC00_001306 [Tulasnella sp. 408]|nr:hypothetical protein FRC00_001306 [Tulasnella sp. 408]
MSAFISENFSDPLVDVVKKFWDLGFTAFGGPPTHFHIIHRRFVTKARWITDEQFKELFALTQSLPGPASTKMAYCIALEHSGFTGACVAFLFWSLPGAAGMFGFSQGVASVGETLPTLVYALLSGLNASTVGIVAVAAVQLSERAITDPVSRLIIIFTAGAGMLYKALWYFPVLMIFSGLMTCWWDVWGGHRLAKRLERYWRRMKDALTTNVAQHNRPHQDDAANQNQDEEFELSEARKASADDQVVRTGSPAVPEPTASGSVVQRSVHGPRSSSHSIPLSTPPRTPPSNIADQLPQQPSSSPPLTVAMGLGILIAFFASFITLLVLRGTLHNAPLLLKLFTNLYLAGTIIFGGGPVVIPLLREYVVTEGWVSSRDFLLGLAIIQAFPGPNFNFGVYLAALTVKGTGTPSIVAGILGWVAIFLPGLTLATCATSLFPLIRKYKFVSSILRGVNAGAVGLVWTAVYRLWEIGYLTPKATSGSSLGLEPWWVVVALGAFSGTRWFKIPAPVSILVGGVMGIAWWGAVGRRGTAVVTPA